MKLLVKPALAGLADTRHDGARRCSTPLSGTSLTVACLVVPGRHDKTRWFRAQCLRTLATVRFQAS